MMTSTVANLGIVAVILIVIIVILKKSEINQQKCIENLLSTDHRFRTEMNGNDSPVSYTVCGFPSNYV